MKIRLGFVSNSSASSFCVYGWQADTWEEAERILKDLNVPNRLRREIDIVCGPYGYYVGASTYYDEIDHYIGSGWEDFEPDRPDGPAVDWIQQQIPWTYAPQYYSYTWFNG